MDRVSQFLEQISPHAAAVRRARLEQNRIYKEEINNNSLIFNGVMTMIRAKATKTGINPENGDALSIYIKDIVKYTLRCGRKDEMTQLSLEDENHETRYMTVPEAELYILEKKLYKKFTKRRCKITWLVPNLPEGKKMTELSDILNYPDAVLSIEIKEKTRTSR